MINVVMLWLVNEKGELLLARRADNIKQDPGLWGPSVTGKVEPGETYEEALVREANEELGLKANTYTFKHLFETEFVHPDGEARHFNVYSANISSMITDSLVIAIDEVAEIKWMSVSDIKKLLNSNPGEVVVASAYSLWNQIFEGLKQ